MLVGSRNPYRAVITNPTYSEITEYTEKLSIFLIAMQSQDSNPSSLGLQSFFYHLTEKVKEESEKVGLKFSIQKTKIMASGPITSWEIDGETVSDFISGGSKITADGDCRHEIKRRLLLRRKVMINLECILKSRDITLTTKVHLVKAMVFPVVMYGCESWTIKKAEHRRIDAFELWCWRRLLGVPGLQGDLTSPS